MNKGSFQSPSLPALAFSSASLTSSRESERAEQHRAAQTLHEQKAQFNQYHEHHQAQTSHRWQRGNFVPSQTQPPVPWSSLQGQSLDWAPAAISPRDLSRQWEKTGGFVPPSAKVVSLSPDTGTRGCSIPTRECFGLEGALNIIWFHSPPPWAKTSSSKYLPVWP